MTFRALRARRGPLGRGAQLRLVAQGAAAVAGLIALCTVLGWALDVPGLRTVLPGLPEMRFNTSLGLLLAALAWFLPVVARLVVLGAVGLLSALTLAEYALRRSTGVDQLFVAQSHGSHPGRIAVETAASLLLIALARAAADWARPGLAELIAGCVLALQALTLLGYAYEVPLSKDFRSSSASGAQASIGLLLLAIAVLATVPGGVLHWSVDAEDAGAMLVRRLLPVALVGLPVVGGLVLLGERHDAYGANTTAALIVVGCAVFVTAVALAAAETLSGVDRRRARAMAQLTELKLDLERQVIERAGQLQRRREEIATLEDRQRVAAELHDEVIQRLFAAGMFLQGTGEDADVQTRRRLDAAVEAMDAAIRDLRASIFELGGGDPLAADMGSAIEDVCTESAGLLGFRPDTTVDDPRLRARDFRDELLSVLREALANVARHAAAAHTHVAMRARDGVLSLTVTDDGRGRSGDAAGTGTRIMTESARRHGGECTWTPVHPHGTRVRWAVPLA